MRGCDCHAGMILPVAKKRGRVKPASSHQVDRLRRADVLSLWSSTQTLIQLRIGEKFGDTHLKVSLPSLRIRSV
jgi:hypothetical protein